MQEPLRTGLVWFRRDLRLQDHAALHLALHQCAQVHCVFVLDRPILDPLPRADRRVAFLLACLAELDAGLRALAGQPHAGLIVLHAQAVDALPELADALGAQAVFAARDYEPQARARDEQVQQRLLAQGRQLRLVKDHVIFEEREVLTQAGKPYTVFTPYLRAWLARLAPGAYAVRETRTLATQLAARPEAYAHPIPTLEGIGFAPSTQPPPRMPIGMAGAQALLDDFAPRLARYAEARNFPAIKGPSYLGMHLRFGTVSIRQLVALAQQQSREGNAGATTWLSELVWREFYFQILANFPHVADSAFKPGYDAIVWEHGPEAEALFAAWCAGRTGYPLVDAAMAQLNQSGYLHNRLRMVAGSFLVKHLGIDWRWGERYFAEKLNDFDLAANNGGWQWVASSGCDAQPYFRIFNPITQSEKFDAQGKFIQRYVPQLAGLDAKSIHAPWLAKPQALATAGVILGKNYPLPIVDHAKARARTLQRYAVVRNAPQDSTGAEQ